jgi:hypothetical protein
MEIEMIVGTTKTLANYDFSADAIKAIVDHLEQHAEEINITLLKKSHAGVYSFSYEKRVKCPYSFIETSKEAIVFIGGDDYVSTIVVTKKLSQTNQESTMSENTKSTTNASKTVAAVTSGEKTAGLINKLAKTATYLSAATAVGFVGYYAWKKFGNSAE